jgi:hypothetical protein
MDPAPAQWVLDREGKKEAGQSLQAVQHSLMRSGSDFYFIDPELFAKADVRDGLVYVNGEPYACVVLPDMCLIEDGAFRTLRAFAESGGSVVIAGQIPSVNIGTEDSAGWFREHFAGKNVPAEETGAAAAAVLEKKIAGYTASVLPEGTYYASGTDPESGKGICFLINTTNRPQELSIGGTDGQKQTVCLGALESRIIDGRLNDTADALTGDTSDVLLPVPMGEWTMHRSDPNVLYLGRFRLTLADGQTGITGGYPIIDQMEETGLKIPVRTRPYFGCPKELAFPGVKAEYEADFDWQIPETKACLVMEPGTMSGGWSMYLNGREINGDSFVPDRLDGRPVLKAEIADICQGRNRLTVHVNCEKDQDGLRNPLYILGDFGVKIGEAVEQDFGKPAQGGRRLEAVAAQTAGVPGKDVENGLPYYAGETCFTQVFSWNGDSTPAVLDLSALELSDAVRVYLNGTDLGVSAWEPRRVRIPQGVLRTGENVLELRVRNTMQGFYEGQTFDRALHRYVDLQDPAAVQEEKHFLA